MPPLRSQEQSDKESANTEPAMPDFDNKASSEFSPSEKSSRAQSPIRENDESSERAFEVHWAQDDQENPRNWSVLYRSWLTFLLGLLPFVASLGSSIISPAEEVIASYLNVSHEVAILTVSLYILGFAVGPLCWGPVSEIWGRRWSLLPALFCLGIFSIATAVSKNAQSIFITRFFGGVFASAPVSNVSAALGDLWPPKPRGNAVIYYSVAVVGGPTIGPVIGSALTVNKHLGWRWTEYILSIWVFVTLILAFFCVPETYSPVLLKKRAKQLREKTGESRYFHPSEKEVITIRTLVTVHFLRPIAMLLGEPMVACVALYASFVYALLYMTLEVFPIIFAQHRHWSLVASNLPFLALFVGVLSAVVINAANQPRYARISDEAGGRPVPEARLAPMSLGGVLFVIGLFWLGWTAQPSVSWISPVFAAGFVGAGFNIIFQQCINYLVDTYNIHAASAVAANTFLRSLLAAGLPLAARPMFGNLGVGPAMSILGGVATLALPIPLVLTRFGKSLRERSSYV